MSRKNPVRLMLNPVRAALAERGYPIPPNDLMIALAKGFGFHNEHELAAALKSGRLTFEPTSRDKTSDAPDTTLIARIASDNTPNSPTSTFETTAIPTFETPAPKTTSQPDNAEPVLIDPEHRSWIVPDNVADDDVKIRTGGESYAAAFEQTLADLLSTMKEDQKLRPLADQARYNIRRYGHATISPASSASGVALAETTDLPEFWSADPEKHGRSVKPFDQEIPAEDLENERLIAQKKHLDQIEADFLNQFQITANTTDTEIRAALTVFMSENPVASSGSPKSDLYRTLDLIISKATRIRDTFKAAKQTPDLSGAIRCSFLRRQFMSEFRISPTTTNEQITSAITDFLAKHRKPSDSDDVIRIAADNIRANAEMMRDMIPSLNSAHKRAMEHRRRALISAARLRRTHTEGSLSSATVLQASDKLNDTIQAVRHSAMRTKFLNDADISAETTDEEITTAIARFQEENSTETDNDEFLRDLGVTLRSDADMKRTWHQRIPTLQTKSSPTNQ